MNTRRRTAAQPPRVRPLLVRHAPAMASGDGATSGEAAEQGRVTGVRVATAHCSVRYFRLCRHAASVLAGAACCVVAPGCAALLASQWRFSVPRISRRGPLTPSHVRKPHALPVRPLCARREAACGPSASAQAGLARQAGLDHLHRPEALRRPPRGAPQRGTNAVAGQSAGNLENWASTSERSELVAAHQRTVLETGCRRRHAARERSQHRGSTSCYGGTDTSSAGGCEAARLLQNRRRIEN